MSSMAVTGLLFAAGAGVAAGAGGVGCCAVASSTCMGARPDCWAFWDGAGTLDCGCCCGTVTCMGAANCVWDGAGTLCCGCCAGTVVGSGFWDSTSMRAADCCAFWVGAGT